jgi:coenzyme F420-reducing hydrogenase delta subunit
MSDAVIVAVVSLAGTLIGSFSGIMAANKLTTYRIEQLEKKVEKHNSVIERVYKLEEHEAAEEEKIEEKFKVVNHRIADLEQYHK